MRLEATEASDGPQKTQAGNRPDVQQREAAGEGRGDGVATAGANLRLSKVDAKGSVPPGEDSAHGARRAREPFRAATKA